MLEHYLFLQRLILLRVQQTHKIGKQSKLLQLLPYQELTLVHITFEKTLAEFFKHYVAHRSRDEVEDLRGFHDLKQIGEFELQFARNLIAVLATSSIFEHLQEPENPGQLAIR